MIESQGEEINIETTKNSNDISSNNNTTEKSDSSNSETLTIKPRAITTKFEIYIVNAYKKLVGFANNKNDIRENEKILQDEYEKLAIRECETELRKALEELDSISRIFLNKNIVDKSIRISKRNKINLSLVLGQIYIKLMYKENLLSKLNQGNNQDKNLIIYFINELINLNNLLKSTYLGAKFEISLFNFLGNVIKEIPFDSEQLNEINIVLQDHKAKSSVKKLNTSNSHDFIASINQSFNNQNSLYEQYLVVLDNTKEIIELINNSNCSEPKDIEDFLEFGVLLIKLLFGKKCILINSKSSNNKNFIKRIFDGQDNINGDLNIIQGEKFFIDYDSDLEFMREKISKIILNYVERFKNIPNLLELQYIHFSLLKRIYFCHYESLEKEVIPLFVQILINLCLYKDKDKIKQVIQFVNVLLNSKDKEDEEFRELLKEKFKEAKNNSDFNFNYDKNIKGNLNQFENETIYIDETNLHLGFFNNQDIEPGETFEFYVELQKPLSLIDFSLIVKSYDIDLTVTNLSDGNIVYQEKKLKAEKTPLKLDLFFTKPGILKFELDNSYSWIRSKSISYKTNVFYPQIPSIFENKIAISKYQEIINITKKISGIKTSNDNKINIKKDQILFTYNIDELKKNIEILNSMIVSCQIKILTIFLDKEKEEGEDKEKKYFYYEKENMVKNELTQENFEEFISENKNKTGNTIVNLFIISGDDSDVLKSKDLSILSVLGFEPQIQDENTNNLLYFIQYYDQAQLLYYLCNKSKDQENALLINYSKFGGYQIAIFLNREIIKEVEELKKINKSEFLENNIELISCAIKKMGEEKVIKILVTDSIDPEEKNITAEKMSETIQKSLGIKSEKEGNYKIIKLNRDYNIEAERYYHLLNLFE